MSFMRGTGVFEAFEYVWLHQAFQSGLPPLVQGAPTGWWQQLQRGRGHLSVHPHRQRDPSIQLDAKRLFDAQPS
jgi:hypothetical protein